MSQANYMQVIEGSERCLNGHPVVEKTTDNTPWKCAEKGCKYANTPTHQEQLEAILGIELKDAGTKVYKLIDISKAYEAITALIQEAVNKDKSERVRKNKSICGCPMCEHHTAPYEQWLTSNSGGSNNE